MRVYLDTCIVVYRSEVPAASQAISEAIERLDDVTLCVSPLVKLEALVMPTKTGATALLEAYERLFATLEMLPISPAVFTRALQFRAFHNLKTPDALHVATALEHGCTEFWTNDLRLSRSTGELAFRVLP